MKVILRDGLRFFGRHGSQKVKIRLRGRGSGYCEGPKKQESNEGMQVCVSGRAQEPFEFACDRVEALLGDI